MDANEITEIAQLMQGSPTPPAPAEERTEPEVPEHEDVPLAAEADEPEQSVADEEPETAEPEPSTIKGLAEKLGMSIDDLYASTELIPGMTLGQAKDRAKDLLAADEMLSTAEDKRITSENELIRKQQEYRLSLQDPDMTQDEVEQRWEATVKAANQQAIDTIDGWADEKVRSADLKAIHGLLKEYGYSVAQSNALLDPTQLRMLNDYSRLRTRVKAASKPVSKSPQKQNRSNANKAVQTAPNRAVDQYNKGEISRNAAVAALMKG